MANPENLKGKGFDAHPENINRKGRPRRLIKKLSEMVQMDFSLDLTKQDKYDLIEWAMEQNLRELSKIASNQESPVFLVNIATALLSDIRNGRTPTVEMIFDRVYGRPNQSIKTSGNNIIQVTEVILKVPSDD